MPNRGKELALKIEKDVLEYVAQFKERRRPRKLYLESTNNKNS